MSRRSATRDVVELPLSKEDVLSLSERLSEPDWVREARLEAWELAESIPVPTTSDEPWRRTDLRKIKWEGLEQFTQFEGASASDIPEELTQPLIGSEQGGVLLFVDGQLVHSEVSESLTRQGVVFSDLKSACETHPELVQKFFMTQAVPADSGKFAALHAALWTHGVILYVPRGVHVDLPLHSVEYLTGAKTTSTHILVVVEEAASATYLHESASATEGAQTFHLGATELIVNDNANLRYVALQNWDEELINIGHQRARIGKNGQLDWIAGEMGTQFSKLFMTLDFDGDDSWGRLSGVYFPHDGQFLDLDTQQNHHALRTTSDLLFKGTLKGKSRSVWQGMIAVDVGAQQTDGFQANRNLLLDRASRADSIPGLEIKADDVRCTHAATAGKVDETEVFYLMSRGIARDEAIKLVVDGFFDPVMQRIPFEGVRDRFKQHITEKLEA